jgi:ABC-type spermidine/putrescine transport system permease subunit I
VPEGAALGDPGDASASPGVAGPLPGLRRLSEYVGFVPAIVLFGAFFLVPLGLIIAYSFWRVVDYRVAQEWTVDNYRNFFSNPTYVRTLWATLWVTAVATVLTIGLAFPFAYWLARHVRRGLQRPLLLLVIFPLWTSYLLRIYAWQTILGEDGAINRLLKAIGLIDRPLSFLLYNRPAVILVVIYLYFPFAVLTLYASLERFDWSLIKAATDLGASSGQAIRRVLVPQIRTGIVTAVIFVSIPVLGEYLVPQLIGGTQGLMIGNLIANFFQGAQYTRGAAVALLIAVLIAGLLVAFRRSLRVAGGLGAPSSISQGYEVVGVRARIARVAFRLYGAVIYVFLFAPIALVIVFSFNASRTGTFPITGWTTKWYSDVLANYDIQSAAWTSLQIALQATVISTVVGTAAAFPLVRSRLPLRSGVRVLLTLPIMIPGLLIGVSLLALFRSAFDVTLSQTTAVIGQSVICTPFVVLIVAAQLEGFDASLERAASDLGASTYRRLRHVVFPLIASAILGAALFAFTVAFDEFIITLFVIGGGNTLPIYIFTQVREGITPEVNALAAMLFCVPVAVLALAVAARALAVRIGRRAAGGIEVAGAVR